MKANKLSETTIGLKRSKLIIEAAEKAFAQNGYKGTSIQTVADMAKLPKTNVMYYFKTKADLYRAVLLRILQVWNVSFDKVTVDDDPALSFAKYIDDKMELSRTQPYVSKVFALEILNGASNLDKHFKQKHQAWLNGRIEVIKGWIEQGKMDNVAPDYLIYHIWSSTQHYADFAAQITDLRGAKMTKCDFKQATNTVISIILKGCGLSVPAQYLEHPLKEKSA